MPALLRGRGGRAGSRRKLAAATATALVCLMLSSAQAAKTKDWPENNKLQRGFTPTKVIVRRIHSVWAQCELLVHARARAPRSRKPQRHRHDMREGREGGGV